MTHWRTKENVSHKKKRQKKDVMSKKEERFFFGHCFGNVQSISKVNTVLTIDNNDYNVTLYPDKNGNICDIAGLNRQNGRYDKQLNPVPSDYTYAMNMLRGQAVQLYL